MFIKRLLIQLLLVLSISTFVLSAGTTRRGEFSWTKTDEKISVYRWKLGSSEWTLTPDTSVISPVKEGDVFLVEASYDGIYWSDPTSFVVPKAPVTKETPSFFLSLGGSFGGEKVVFSTKEESLVSAVPAIHLNAGLFVDDYLFLSLDNMASFVHFAEKGNHYEWGIQGKVGISNRRWKVAPMVQVGVGENLSWRNDGAFGYSLLASVDAGCSFSFGPDFSLELLFSYAPSFQRDVTAVPDGLLSSINHRGLSTLFFTKHWGRGK